MIARTTPSLKVRSHKVRKKKERSHFGRILGPAGEGEGRGIGEGGSRGWFFITVHLLRQGHLGLTVFCHTKVPYGKSGGTYF